MSLLVTQPGAPTPELSIVIVTRNEESAIGLCLESVVRSVQGKRAEIVLVDSASTDDTVKIAAGFPVTVLQLGRTAELSPAAGRFVGTRRTAGPFIHFLDGDMILIDGWLDAALDAMRNQSLAAVGGRLFYVYPGESLTREHRDSYVPGPIASLGGAGLYRRSAVDASGGFNPFVKGEEERELGHRIAQHGFAMRRIDIPMVYHLNKTRTLTEVDEKAGHFVGVGQILRAHRGSTFSRDVLRRQTNVLRKAALVLVALLVAVVLMLAGPGIVRWILLGLALVGAAVLLGTGMFRKALLFLRFNLRVLLNVARGLLRGIPDAATYHADVAVIHTPHGERP